MSAQLCRYILDDLALSFKPDDNNSYIAPFLKAAIRDVKGYIKSKAYRAIPVGFAYSYAWPPSVPDYLTCSANASENADFFATHVRLDCDKGKSSPRAELHREAEKVANASSSLPAPIFITSFLPPCENGSFVGHDGVFDDQREGKTLSGALLGWDAQYPLPDDRFLVRYSAQETDEGRNSSVVEAPTPVMPGFASVQQKWKNLNPSGINISDYSPKLTAPACPMWRRGEWAINGSVPLPTLGQVFDEKLRRSWEEGELKGGASKRRAGLLYPVLFWCLIFHWLYGFDIVTLWK